MIAKQTVYLNQDRSQAVPEGHADAKFLLVKAGHEVPEALVEKHDALDLVSSAPKAKKEEPAQKGPAPENREQAMPKRRQRKAK